VDVCRRVTSGQTLVFVTSRSFWDVKQRRVWDRRLIEHVATPRLLGALSVVSAVSLVADGL
jgi:hypothetical protein